MASKLRIAAPVFFAAITVALVMMWVRSYEKKDICGITFANYKRTNFCAMQGRIFLIVLDFETYRWAIGKNRDWDIRSETTSADEVKGEPHFLFKKFDGYYRVIMPYWLLVMVGITFAALPWLPHRFSLRTMLIATTLVAVVLRLGVWTIS